MDRQMNYSTSEQLMRMTRNSSTMMQRQIVPVITLVLFAVAPAALWAQFDHSIWDGLLSRHVVEMDQGRKTRVNYTGMEQEREQLGDYLDSLAAVTRTRFDAWPLSEQLAFLINSYNAWTVELILTEYPQLDSIRDIGFLPGAAWRRKIVELFGSQVSLDTVEHEMIRGWDRFQDPRIHFAVNCAAIGCPALRSEAYSGDRLDMQLDSSARQFLADSDRNYLRDNSVYVSRIFDWYEEDFDRGWNGIDSVQEFLLRYADALDPTQSQIEALREASMRIRYLEYDWRLNDVQQSGTRD